MTVEEVLRDMYTSGLISREWFGEMVLNIHPPTRSDAMEEKKTGAPAAVVNGSQWKIRDRAAAGRTRISFDDLGHHFCTVMVGPSGRVVRNWSNGLTGSSASVAEFLASFIPAAAAREEAPAVPAPVVDTDETRQAAFVARTDALTRRLKLDAGYPECVTCHSAVERVGKSGMCPECWRASRGAKPLDGDLAMFPSAKLRSLGRVAAAAVVAPPFVPSVWEPGIPDA